MDFFSLKQVPEIYKSSNTARHCVRGVAGASPRREGSGVSQRDSREGGDFPLPTLNHDRLKREHNMRFSTPNLADINPEIMMQHFVGTNAPASHHDNLDWPDVLSAIAARCHSEEAACDVQRFPQLTDSELVARRFAEVQELTDFFDLSDPVISIRLVPLDEILAHAEVGSILSGKELLLCAAALRTFRETRQFFRVRQDDAPLCWQYADDIEDCYTLEKRLFASFSPDGELVDEASPELAHLRERARRLNESLRSRIETKLGQSDVQQLLQDTYFTLREGRYVLPIQAQYRSRFSGIVHATSASGQTVFVEPGDLVELNNALQIADFDTKAEEQRVLQALTKEVGSRRELFLANTRRCLYLDALTAVAQFSLDCRCHVPDICDREIELYQARHPLLALRHFENEAFTVVANDILLADPASALVISGANAGGKTVNLKLVGLFALMMKAGIPLCAGASSAMPVFDGIFADIGDDQSIAANISTFSAHIQSLSKSLPEANGQSLFLLDEPFSGTDPEHASPLVMALLRYLRARRVTTLVTTHFENVKAFALDTDWTEAACVSFNMETMRPTYKLSLGQPGSSAAFEIASQHGLPDEILSDARAQYDDQSTSALETAISKLAQQRVALDEALDKTRETQEALEKEKAETDKLREDIRARVAKALGCDIESVQDQIAKLKARLRKLRQKSYQGSTFAKSSDARDELSHALSDLENEVQHTQSAITEITAPPFEQLHESELVEGRRVQIHQYHKNATILSRNGRKFTLQLGALQVHANLEDLGAPLMEEDENPKLTRYLKRMKNAPLPVEPDASGHAVDEETKLPILPQMAENTIDLRGLASDDAIERTEFFLESMRMHEQPMCYIIHGHGTGILKAAIRKYLTSSPLIKATRPGQYYEGGDGATLAWLK